MTDEEKKKQQPTDEDEENEDLEDEEDGEEGDEILDGEDESGEEEGDESDEEEDDDEEEGGDGDFTEKDLEDPEKRKLVLARLKKAKSDAVQRAIWKKRAMKSGYKKEAPQGSDSSKAKKSSTNDEILRSNERNEFRIDHPDIPRAMVDEIEIHARAKGTSLEKALRSPLIQTFVNNKKLKERLAKASPSSRHRSPQTAPAKDWSKATSAEIAAHAAEIRRRASN